MTRVADQAKLQRLQTSLVCVLIQKSVWCPLKWITLHEVLIFIC